MTNITIYEKGTAKVLTQDVVNSHHSVYKVNIEKNNIAKAIKVNNNLEVYLLNGEKVVIEDFFVGEKPKEFTIETADGQHFLLNFLAFDTEGVATKIDYLSISDFHEYLVGDDSAVVPIWAWVAGAAGLIGIAAAAGGSGGSSHSDNGANSGDHTGPKLTIDVIDNKKINIKADEASKIEIKDANGNTIGSGQLNQAGEIDITLSRPLQDNETITIIATDTSGNKTPETINVGDVTKPEVSVDIVDENTIQIDSNEPGSKVEITDSAGNKIAEGIIDENGQLIVDVDKPLNPGDKIIVNVTDEAGNKTTEEVPIDEFTGGGNSGSADKQPPVFESADVNTLGQIELHYSEELDADNLPAANQFVVKVDGKTIPAENITVSVIDQQVILTLNPPIYTGQTVTVSYQDATVGDDLNAIQDLRGNDAADLPETALTNKSTVVDPTDKTPPIIKTEVTDATHIEVTSNESGTVEIKDVAGNVIGSGTITGNDTPDNIQLTRPLVDGETVTVVVTDAAKNEGKETVKVGDVTVPEFDHAEVNGAGQLVLSYNEQLDANNPPQASDFSVKIDGTLVTPSDIRIDGQNVILSFSPAIYTGQTVEVSYSDPTVSDDSKAIQDLAGNDAAGFTTTVDPANNGSTQVPPAAGDTTPPSLTGTSVNADGKLVLSYNEQLDANNPPQASDFSVKIDGTLVTPSDIRIDGQNVILSFSPAIYTGQTVEVSYSDPTVSDDSKAIQDLAGNDAAGFTTTVDPANNGSTQVPPVVGTPPVLLSSVATPNGEIVLTFDQALSSDLPNVSSFVLLVNGQSVVINSISFTDTTHESIVLHTSPAIPKDASVSLIYMDPTSSDDANAIQNVNGLDGASFQVVVNTLNGLDPLLAKNDFNTVDFGLESVAVWDDIINAQNTKVIGLLDSDSESLGVEFTLPKNGDPAKDYSSDVLITIQQQDLLSVATGFSVIIMRKNDQGIYEQYAVKTVQNGGVIADSSLLQVLGIVGDGNTIAVSLDDLPEGDYKAVIASDQSVLSDVLTELTLAELASGEKLLGAENEELVINTLKALLEAKGQGNLLSTVVVGLVSGLLDTVNGVRLDVLVKALTDLPILKNVLNAADFITGIVAGLVASTLTIYEQTDITISGKDYYFEPKTITGSLYEEVNKPQNDDLLGYQASAKVTLIQILDSSGQVITTQTIDPQDAETEIVGLYGTFTLYADGTYSYSANGSHVSIGQKEYINYTISDGYNQDSSAQLQITISGQNQTPVTPSGQELYATTDIKVGHLEIIPTITNIAQTGSGAPSTITNDGKYVEKKTGFVTVGLDLGPVLDLGLLESSSNTGNQNVGIRLSVGSGKVEELNIKADVGGVVIGTMDFYVYKLNVTTGYYEQYLAKPDWFGAFLGGVSPLTPLTLTEGDYVLLMNAGSGLAALTGYTLYVINEKVYDYNSVDGIKLDGSTNLTLEGNVLTDNSGYGVDKLTTDAKLYAVNGVKFGSDTSITVNGKYGTLKINQDGTYSYTINPTATGYVGQKDTFSYTLYDAKLGLSSTANLIIDLTTLNLKADFDAVQLVNTTDINNNVVFVSKSGTASFSGDTYTYNFSLGADNFYHDTKLLVTAKRYSLGAAGSLVAKIINSDTGAIVYEPSAISIGSHLTNTLTLIDNQTISGLSNGNYKLILTIKGNGALVNWDAKLTTISSSKFIEADSTTAVVETGNIFSNDDLGSVTTHGRVLISGKEMYLNSTITQDSSSLTIVGSYGTLVLEKSGNYTYTANGSGYGIEKFTYTITAADGTSEQAVLSINVGSKFVGSIYQDMLYSTAGNDTISTSGSSDTVIFKLLSNTDATGGNGKDTWTDFHVGNVTTDAEADKVDLSALLIGFNSANITSDLTASTAYLKNYLGVKVDGDDVTLTIDRDGAGTAYTVKTDLLQMNGLAQTGAAFNGKTEDDILKLLLQNHQLGF